MNFGKAIKELRKEKGWSQKELSEYSGLSQTAISFIESGKTVPQSGTIKLLAKTFDAPEPFIYFLSLEDNDIPEHKKEIFKVLSPTLDSIMKQIINEG